MKQAIYNSQGFEWDDGNSETNELLHEVTYGECEEVFFNLPLVMVPDTRRSQREPRYFALGRTNADRWLFIYLKPTTKSISLRLPLPMLNELRLLANKRDVPYQSLIKMFLHERIDQELRRDQTKTAA